MPVEPVIDPKVEKVLRKIAYHGFWVVFILRFFGFYYSYELYMQQDYIWSVLLLIVSVPSFEYVCLYAKHIKLLLKRVIPVKSEPA